MNVEGVNAAEWSHLARSFLLAEIDLPKQGVLKAALVVRCFYHGQSRVRGLNLAAVS